VISGNRPSAHKVLIACGVTSAQAGSVENEAVQAVSVWPLRGPSVSAITLHSFLEPQKGIANLPKLLRALQAHAEDLNLTSLTAVNSATTSKWDSDAAAVQLMARKENANG